jgi:hypothetical protein
VKYRWRGLRIEVLGKWDGFWYLFLIFDFRHSKHQLLSVAIKIENGE